MTETVLTSLVDLRVLLARALEQHGCSQTVAAIIAQNMAMAEQDGATSHGVFRLAGYISSLQSGWVDGMATPRLEDVAPGMLRVDAQNGFCQPALAAARDLLKAKARTNGISLLAIRQSHHLGALWPDVEPFACEGFVAISMVNSFACVVPHGGQEAVFGTNPLAFAAPRATSAPLVFDQATSSMANGEVQILAREGKPLPLGFGIDSDGAATTDPNAVLDGGALLPFGGVKGSSISMMIEILGAALTGGNFSFEVDWSAHPGAATPRSGQMLILVDPSQGATRPFATRLESLLTRMRGAGQARLPGERRYANREKARRCGIPIASNVWQDLQALARSAPLSDRP